LNWVELNLIIVVVMMNSCYYADKPSSSLKNEFLDQLSNNWPLTKDSA